MFFDAPERTFRNISFGVYNRDPSWLERMLELLVTAGLRYLEPAVVLEHANDFPAVHRIAPLTYENTHFVYTHQGQKCGV